MESIYRFGSCYLHQNIFHGRSLCYIDDTVFVSAPVVAVAAVIAVAALADFSIQNSYVVLLYRRPAESFCHFSGLYACH
jgi:hypothetical protein